MATQQAHPIHSTNQLSSGFASEGATHELVVGPLWQSFEEFRTAGNAGLDRIPLHGVAILNCKAGSFRILRDADFQRVLGLAADVSRLQRGLKVVIQAARVAVKHPDEDHIKLLIDSASLIAECPELPQREGHEALRLTDQEVAEEASDNFDARTAEIPRPQW
jgi:hypothetical protein